MFYLHFILSIFPTLKLASNMKRDEYGIILDETGDGGDSANREGLYALFSNERNPLDVFEVLPGWITRHPKQVPWDNPKNFSRDQLIPYVAGCYKQGQSDIVRRVFWAHAKRFFFCQNFERDIKGSTKYPWPHNFINDHGYAETKAFDFADILLPNDIGHLILCGRLWYFYWFLPLSYLFLALTVVTHCRFDESNDEGQILSECVIAGSFFVFLYKKLKPDWMLALANYWVIRRNMRDMYETIVKALS